MIKAKKNKRHIKYCAAAVIAVMLLLFPLFLFTCQPAAISASAQSTAGEQLDPKIFDAKFDTNENFAYGSGSGWTVDEPFLIATPAHLDNVRNYAVKPTFGGYFFKVICDIDMADYLSEGGAGYNKGKGFEPISQEYFYEEYSYTDNIFRGTFDGGGYKISNFFINRPDERNIGLFANLVKSKIINVNLVLSDTGITGKYYVGGIAGLAEGDGESSLRTTMLITGCSVIGKVTAREATPRYTIESCVGGIVGTIALGTVSTCYVQGAVSGKISVGGIIGDSNNSDISDCWFNGSVNIIDLGGPDIDYAVLTAKLAKAGGIAGKANSVSKIINCLNAGSSADERVAAIAAAANYLTRNIETYKVAEYSLATLQSCYYNKDIFIGPLIAVTDEKLVTGGSRGLTADELKDKANLAGWDFEDVWGYDKDGNLILRQFFDNYIPPVILPKDLLWLWLTLLVAGTGLIAATFIVVIKRKKIITQTVTETVEIIRTVEVPVPVKPHLPEGLTERELEIAKLILKGLHRKEMTAALSISESTVKKHIAAVYKKSGCNNKSGFRRKYGGE